MATFSSFFTSLLLKVLLHLGSRTPQCEKFCEGRESGSRGRAWATVAQQFPGSRAVILLEGEPVCLVFPLPELPASFGSWPFPPFAKHIIPQSGSTDTSPFWTYPPWPPYNDLEDDIEPRWIFQNTVYLRVPNLTAISVIHRLQGLGCEHHWGGRAGGLYSLSHFLEMLHFRDQLTRGKDGVLKLGFFDSIVKILWFVLPFKPTYTPTYPILRKLHRKILSSEVNPRLQERNPCIVPRMAALGFLIHQGTFVTIHYKQSLSLQKRLMRRVCPRWTSASHW